jgi:dolichol-phosphate mannosyltransferase
MSIGIVIPSYNEKESIVALLTELRAILPQVELVVVDDSPTQDTVNAIKQANLAAVEVIHRTTKGGRGSAVLEGLRYLLSKNCELYLEMDADFSHSPSELPGILSHLKNQNLDMLIASRYLPESQIVNWPLSRRVFSRASNILARFVLGIPIVDYTNGYRCYTRKAAQHVVNTCGRYGKGFISLSEILVNLYYAKYEVGEIPTRFVNRVRGESSVNQQEIKNALVGLFKIYQHKKNLEKSIYHE